LFAARIACIFALRANYFAILFFGYMVFFVALPSFLALSDFAASLGLTILVLIFPFYYAIVYNLRFFFVGLIIFF
jgi:hypothetical protein